MSDEKKSSEPAIDESDIFLKKFNDGKSDAFEKAESIRQFEIQLYWTRANYFFIFVSAAFVAYGIALGWKTSDIGISEQSKKMVLMLIAGMGFLVSLAWYLANKGSKFWQENWEYHVDLLEPYPLYRTVLSSEPNGIGWLRKNPRPAGNACVVDKCLHGVKLFAIPIKNILFDGNSSYPYSPTKINLILSRYSTMLFFLIFTASFARFASINFFTEWVRLNGQVVAYGLFILTLWFAVKMIISAKSSSQDTNQDWYITYRDTSIKENITPNK